MLDKYLRISEQSKPPHLRDDVFVTPDCRLVNGSGHSVTTELSCDGEPVIELDWFDGRKKYPVALLVLHVFKPVHIPLKYWTYIKPLYVNGHKDNTHIDNLYWWFPAKTIESESMPGFFYIPGATRYLVNCKGDVYNAMLGKFQNKYLKSGEGDSTYLNVSLRQDDDEYRLLRVHRLVAMAFLGYEVEQLSKHVNHKDGMPNNNDVDNLEWATPQENIEHALESGLTSNRWVYRITHCYSGEVVENLDLNDLRDRAILTNAQTAIELFKEDCSVLLGQWVVEKVKANFERTPPRETYEVKNIVTGEITSFKKKSDVARYFGIGYLSCNLLLEKGPTVLLPGRQLIRVVERHDWPESTADLPIFEFGRRAVLIRKVATGEVLDFDQVTAAANYLGINKDAMLYRLEDPTEQRIWPDYTQCQYKEKAKPWRNPQDAELEIAQNTWKKAVDVRDIRSGIVTRYASRREAAKASGNVESVVSIFLMKDDITTTRNGFQFKLAIDNRPWPVIEDPVWELAIANQQRPIVAIDSQTQQERFFISSKNCADAFGYPASNLSYWMTKAPTTLPNGWRVDFYKKRSSASM